MAKKVKKPKPVKKSAVKKRGGLRPTAVAKRRATKKKPVKASAPRKRRPAYKPRAIPECSIENALGDAFSEIESLKDEMQEICDNMSGMEHLPKYDVAETAMNELESHCECPDVPELLKEIKISTLSEMVPTRKGRASGRSMRLSNATSVIKDVIEFLNEGIVESTNHSAEVKEAAREYAEELSEHEDFDVEFPGMYG